MGWDTKTSLCFYRARCCDALFGSEQRQSKLEEMEKKYDEQFKIVFEAIRHLMQPPEKPKRQIGFQVKEPKLQYSVICGKNIL